MVAVGSQSWALGAVGVSHDCGLEDELGPILVNVVDFVDKEIIQGANVKVHHCRAARVVACSCACWFMWCGAEVRVRARGWVW